MTKSIGTIATVIIMFSTLISCGNSDSNNNDNKVEVNFVEAYCFEGECDYVFQFKNDEEISFFKNYFDPDGAEIDFDFFDQDNLETNPEWVGQTFIIEYKFVEDIKLNIATGELEGANVITKIELK